MHNNIIFDIKFDPFDPKKFASISEDAVKIFDIRMTKRALV